MSRDRAREFGALHVPDGLNAMSQFGRKTPNGFRSLASVVAGSDPSSSSALCVGVRLLPATKDSDTADRDSISVTLPPLGFDDERVGSRTGSEVGVMWAPVDTRRGCESAVSVSVSVASVLSVLSGRTHETEIPSAAVRRSVDRLSALLAMVTDSVVCSVSPAAVSGVVVSEDEVVSEDVVVSEDTLRATTDVSAVETAGRETRSPSTPLL